MVDGRRIAGSPTSYRILEGGVCLVEVFNLFGMDLRGCSIDEDM